MHSKTWQNIHYMEWNYLTLHSTTSHYITLHYITLHYITLHSLHYIALHYIALHCIALHYITLHYSMITYIFYVCKSNIYCMLSIQWPGMSSRVWKQSCFYTLNHLLKSFEVLSKGSLSSIASLYCRSTGHSIGCEAMITNLFTVHPTAFVVQQGFHDFQQALDVY